MSESRALLPVEPKAKDESHSFTELLNQWHDQMIKSLSIPAEFVSDDRTNYSASRFETLVEKRVKQINQPTEDSDG